MKTKIQFLIRMKMLMIIVIIVAFVISGCNLSSPDKESELISETPDTDINLNLIIQEPVPMMNTVESKGIDTHYYEVYQLIITLTHITSLVSQEITWIPGDENTLPFHLTELGEYEIVVTHFGCDLEDNEIQLSESTTFVIQPHIITVITIIPGAIGTIIISTEDPITGSETLEWDFTTLTELPSPLYNRRSPDTITFSETGALMTNDITDNFNSISLDIEDLPKKIIMTSTIVNKHRESVPYYTFLFRLTAADETGNEIEGVFLVMSHESCVMRFGFGVDDTSSIRERQGTGYSPWGNRYYIGNPEYEGWNEDWSILEDNPAVFELTVDFTSGSVDGVVTVDESGYTSHADLDWILQLADDPDFDHLVLDIRPSTWWTDNFWTEVQNFKVKIED